MRSLDNVLLSMTYIRLGSEADCLFSCLSISGTAEFESVSGYLRDRRI